MKSLRESLFDSETQMVMESLFDKDLITKKLTFGDLFTIDEDKCRWENCDLQKTFSDRKVKKDSKVSGGDKDEIIFNGFVKMILDIKLDEHDVEDMHKIWFKSKVYKCICPYYREGFAIVPPGVFFFNKGRLVLYRDKGLFDTDFDTIQISIPAGLSLVFRRK